MSYLFDDFNTVDAKTWKQKIQVDLKGADYNDILIWKTDEGIDVKPFYTKLDAENITNSYQKDSFKICQTIDVINEVEANAKAVSVLKNGANAIEFLLSKVVNIDSLLKNINPSVHLYFKLDFFDVNFCESIIKLSEKYQNIFLNLDIIGNLASTGNWFKNKTKDFQNFETLTKHNNSICVNVSLYQNAGATMVQQLAYAIAHANEYINFYGDSVANNIHFNVAVGSNYFFEIAKLRALRVLWESLLVAHNIKVGTELHIFCRPTLRNKTVFDYNVNMLRTTSECMSAVLGGADTISNLPYDEVFNNANDFGDRISKNQLLVIKHECELIDEKSIADGSYYIDSLTNQLANKALEIFKDIESSGGFLKQLFEGTIQRKIKESTEKEQEKFDKKEILSIGTNTLINEKESFNINIEKEIFTKNKPRKTLIEPILKKRLSEEIEKQRLK